MKRPSTNISTFTGVNRIVVREGDYKCTFWEHGDIMYCKIQKYVMLKHEDSMRVDDRGQMSAKKEDVIQLYYDVMKFCNDNK